MSPSECNKLLSGSFSLKITFFEVIRGAHLKWDILYIFIYSCSYLREGTEKRGKNFQKIETEIETIKDKNGEGKLKCNNSFKISEYSNSF